MKQICVDSHVLIWGIKEFAEDGQEEMIPRTKSFFEDCRSKDIKIMIPAVVLGELLTAIEPRYHAMTLNLVKSSFLIPPFDAASSAAFAKLWRERKESGAVKQIHDELQATRQELKADCMIVATSIVHKADAIFSHDVKLKNFAGGAIPVLEIPRAPHQVTLDLRIPSNDIPVAPAAEY